MDRAGFSAQHNQPAPADVRIDFDLHCANKSGLPAGVFGLVLHVYMGRAINAANSASTRCMRTGAVCGIPVPAQSVRLLTRFRPETAG